MIKRIIEADILENLYKKKVILIMGPRQTGKTTLVKAVFEKFQGGLWLDGDEPDIRARLTDVTSDALKRLFGSHKLVVIDEAQRIRNIGITLKIVHDKLPDIQIIAMGSSSFELASEIKEPLTGRKYEYLLYPFSTEELAGVNGMLYEARLLEDRLVFGQYPEVINHQGKEREILKDLSDSYLYKDVLAFESLRKPDLLERLLQALALQLGSEVSFNELAQLLGVDPQTVEKYILLLERAFVIFRLPSLARNLRNELKRSRKIYFYDNGIRNAVISNFQAFSLRTDGGALWENFLVSERMKYNRYHHNHCNAFFWRTLQQQEVDYVEEMNGRYFAYEFKLKNKKGRLPLTFQKAYPETTFKVIDRDNYTDFIAG